MLLIFLLLLLLLNSLLKFILEKIKLYLNCIYIDYEHGFRNKKTIECEKKKIASKVEVSTVIHCGETKL